MNFIKLTLSDNTDVIVNFDLVSNFHIADNTNTTTYISFLGEELLLVQGTPEDILDKLGLLK